MSWEKSSGSASVMGPARNHSHFHWASLGLSRSAESRLKAHNCDFEAVIVNVCGPKSE